MAKLAIKAGTTSKLVDISIKDSSSTTGAGLTGLAWNTGSLTAYYYREGAASAVAITLATMTLGTWATGGFIVIDGTNMPGCYQLGLPDAAIAAGAKSVLVMLKGATNMAQCLLEIELTAWDNQDAVRGGMTALPNAAAESSGGLFTRGSGAGQINQTVNGLANVNLIDILGTAVSTPATAGVLDVNVKNINNVVAATPGATGGVLIAGTNAATTITGSLTTTFTGSLTGNVNGNVGGNVTGSVGSVASGGITAASIANGAIDAATFAAGAIDAAAIAPAAIDAATFAAGAIDAAAIANGAIDAATFAAGAIDAAAIANGAIDAATFAAGALDTVDRSVLRKNTATASAAGTLTLDASASAVNDYYTGNVLVILSGTGAGQAREISGYVGSTKVATVTPNWATTPSATSDFAVLANMVLLSSASFVAGTIATVSDIVTGVWTEALPGAYAVGSAGKLLSSAGAAADPWVTALPGAYAAGTAGFRIGTYLDAAISSRLAPTVAARTLDVSATGEAGIDWGNIGSATGAVNLSGTTFSTAQVVASVSGNVGGNVTGSVGSVAANGITSSSLAANAINAASIATGAITSAKFAANAITATVIADGSIDAATFAAGAIDINAIATGAISSTKFAAGAINAAAIAAAAITNTTFAAGAIDATAIASAAITAAKFAANAIDASALATTAVTEIVTAVWTEPLPGAYGVGSAGKLLSAAGAAGDPWAVNLPGAYVAGTAGFIVGTNVDATISSRLAPTVAARTLDVSATGEAGVDWANVGGQATAVNLANTVISGTQTITTVTGNVNGSVGSVTGAVGSVTGNVGGSVASVVGAVGSVSGNVGGNVVGSVGSVAAGGIAAATFAANAINASALASDAVAEIATGVWQDATAGDFTVAGSIGKALYVSNAVPGAAGGHLIAGVNAATTVNITGNITGNLSGTVGAVTGSVGGNVTGSVGSVTGNVGGNVVGSVASVVGAVGSVTGNVGGNVVGSVGSLTVNNDKVGYALSAAAVDAILDDPTEGGVTLRQLIRGISASTMGKASGAGTATNTFRDVNDTKDVIVAIVDANGNRTNVVLDLT